MMYSINDVLESLFKEVDNTISKNTYNLRSDVYEYDDKYEILVNTPGVKKEDINITYDNKYLLVSVNSSKDCNENLILNERNNGIGKRRFYLDSEVMFDDIKANLNYGVLTIVLPKRQNKKTNIVIE